MNKLHVKPIYQRPLDALIFVFMCIHVPITVLIDSQLVFPQEWYPKFALDLLNNFINDFEDPLLANPPAWFQAMVYCEIYFQFLFCVMVPFGIVTGARWTRIATLVYGVHVATTLVPIIGYYLSVENWNQKWSVIAINAPYFFVPLFMAIKMAFGWNPYVTVKADNGKKKS
eukprot:TRINITY_DN19031_c0_g1_i1.p3 TRINITY_DN19031_c0_g1~~TRINITY_DN19031_c0_g1_i1.p3  ORF type:complete len:171 (-),score=12.29 TRINITY_DN19031_c0_g1_i1:378-890(-)